MAKEQWITKKLTRKNPEYGKVDGAKKTITVEEQYRVDSDFKPKAIDEICIEFIEAYCVANDSIKWLLELVNSKVPAKAKDGTTKEIDIPFVNIRAEFAKKFFPSIIKGEPEKKPSLKDKLNEKYGSL